MRVGILEWFPGWPSLALLLGLTLATTPSASRADKPTDPPEPIWTAEQREHWSFLPPVHHDPPAVGAKAWVRNPIDAFILKPIEEAGLAPAARPTAQP